MKQKELFELSPLFEDVQMQRIFTDGKTFVDCIPKQPLELILQQYEEQKHSTDFNLSIFVQQQFPFLYLYFAQLSY